MYKLSEKNSRVNHYLSDININTKTGIWLFDLVLVTQKGPNKIGSKSREVLLEESKTCSKQVSLSSLGTRPTLSWSKISSHEWRPGREDSGTNGRAW